MLLVPCRMSEPHWHSASASYFVCMPQNAPSPMRLCRCGQAHRSWFVGSHASKRQPHAQTSRCLLHMHTRMHCMTSRHQHFPGWNISWHDAGLCKTLCNILVQSTKLGIWSDPGGIQYSTRQNISYKRRLKWTNDTPDVQSDHGADWLAYLLLHARLEYPTCLSVFCRMFLASF